MSEPAKAAHAEIAHSAKVLKESAVDQTDSADRRTELAADRTVLAAERTYAAWVRTGLAALASGIGARALLENVVAQWLVLTAGATLVLFSAFCFVAAVWRQINPRVRRPKPDAQRIPDPLLILVNGILVLVSLGALIGVLTAR